MKKSEEMMRLDRDLKADPELAKKFNEAIAEAAKSEACENENELIALVAKSLGYEISAGELERIKAAKEELDPEEMTLAAGGEENCECLWKTKKEDEYGHANKCLTAWHCEIVTLHTETKSTDVWCFSKYRCSDVEICWTYFCR